MEKEELGIGYHTKHKPCDFLQKDGSCKLAFEIFERLKNICIPEIQVTDEEIDNQYHINRFQLNGSRFSNCIIELCADIVFLYENGVETCGKDSKANVRIL